MILSRKTVVSGLTSVLRELINFSELTTFYILAKNEKNNKNMRLIILDDDYQMMYHPLWIKIV